MSSDAERAAADKTEADKKAAEDASAAATAAAASAWPTGGYTAFIPLLIIFVLAVLASFVDLSTICVVHACLDQYQYVVSSLNAMLVIYLWIKLVEKLPIFLAVEPDEDKHTQGRNMSQRPRRDCRHKT